MDKLFTRIELSKSPIYSILTLCCILTILIIPLQVKGYDWVTMHNEITGVNCYETLELLPVFEAYGTDDGLYIPNDADELVQYPIGNLPIIDLCELDNTYLLVAAGAGSRSDGIYTFNLNTYEHSVQQWALYPNFVQFHEGYFYAGYRDGLVRTQDGFQWEAVDYFNGSNVLAMDSYNGVVVVSATGNVNGTHYSADNGANWTGGGDTETIMCALEFVDENMLMGIYNDESWSDGFYTSSDYGQTWDLEFYSHYMSSVVFYCDLVFLGWEDDWEDHEGFALWDRTSNEFEFLNDGLECTDINSISYNDMIDCVNAVICTPFGVYMITDFPEIHSLKANLIAPEDEAVIPYSVAECFWSEVDCPTPAQTCIYDIQWSEDSEFSTYEQRYAGTDTSYVIEDISDDHTYYWRVVTTDPATDDYDYSRQVFSFSMAMPEPPADFALSSPANNSELTPVESSNLTFNWEASSDPDPNEDVQYNLYINVVNMNNAMLSYANLTDNQIAINLPDSLGLEYWEETLQVTWYVEAHSNEDVTRCNADFNFSVFAQSSVNQTGEMGLPEEFSIRSVYPNPFNPQVNIDFAVPYESRIQAVVFDVLGREVASLSNSKFQQGYHRLVWKPNNETGIYFIRFTNDANWSEVRKVIYLK